MIAAKVLFIFPLLSFAKAKELRQVPAAFWQKFCISGREDGRDERSPEQGS
jgi:hypothetical protein